MPAAAVQQGMAAAIRAGATTADVVAVEARKAAALVPEPADDSAEEIEPPPWAEPSGVVSPTARRGPTAQAQKAVADSLALRPAAEMPTEGHRWTTTETATRIPSPRRDTGSEEAVDTAIDEACRTLHLPRIRSRVQDMAGEAMRQRSSCKGFLADLLQAECAEREERRELRLLGEANFPGPSGWRTSTSRRTPTSPRNSSAPCRTRPGSGQGSRSV